MLATASENKRLTRLILILVVLVTLTLGIISWLNHPALYPDPSWGFQVLRGMQMGGGFNQLTMPNQDDVSQNTSEFLTWWSPGQYLIPYLFKAIFHLNYGQATIVTTLVCELLGLAGFYVFFKKAGFSSTIAAISIAIIASQQFYFIPYVFYNGGEVLLFGFAGWFMYGCVTIRKTGWPLLAFVLLTGWIGFICKSSFMWAFAAGLCCLWINISYRERKIGKWIQNGIWIGIPALVSLGCIFIFYLSKGQNPGSATRSLKVIWETFSFPLASPLLSGFSIDDIVGGLIYHPDGAPFTYFWTIYIILACSALSIFILLAILRQVNISREYKAAVASFYIVAVLFFSYAFVRQLAISYEGRHFRVVGLLFIPGIVYLISQIKLPFKLIAGLLWIGMTSLSLKYLVRGKELQATDSAHGSSGITQQFIDQPSLNYITKLDQQHHNAIFVFISADLALEINHNRVITLEPVGADIKLNYENYIYDGHSGPVYIVLPADYILNSKAAIITKCFPDYKNFKETDLSDDFVLYSAE